MTSGDTVLRILFLLKLKMSQQSKQIQKTQRGELLNLWKRDALVLIWSWNFEVGEMSWGLKFRGPRSAYLGTTMVGAISSETNFQSKNFG